jgi:hypothetical protein
MHWMSVSGYRMAVLTLTCSFIKVGIHSCSSKHVILDVVCVFKFLLLLLLQSDIQYLASHHTEARIGINTQRLALRSKRFDVSLHVRLQGRTWLHRRRSLQFQSQPEISAPRFDDRGERYVDSCQSPRRH